jgi:hypothetical protein
VQFLEQFFVVDGGLNLNDKILVEGVGIVTEESY